MSTYSSRVMRQTRDKHQQLPLLFLREALADTPKHGDGRRVFGVAVLIRCSLRTETASDEAPFSQSHSHRKGTSSSNLSFN